MILIGQFDSPFVRRVGVALRLYGLAFEHRPWSTFADAQKVAAYNPLLRVPILVRDDGEILIESAYILEYLDTLAPGAPLIPASGDERQAQLQIIARATGLADKAVALVYEGALHKEVSAMWQERCRAQIGATLSALEARCAALTTPYWAGEAIGHADVATACALRFLSEAHPGLFDARHAPRLFAAAAACEATHAFIETYQAFDGPKD